MSAALTARASCPRSSRPGWKTGHGQDARATPSIKTRVVRKRSPLFQFRGGFLRSPILEKKFRLIWAVTTRARGDMKDAAAFRRALRRLGLNPGFWAGGEQVHGRRVRWTRRASSAPLGASGTDGTATDRPGLVLRVFGADCASILLADARGRAMAMVHAGWRGASKGVLERAVRLLGMKAGVRPAELGMVVGPCIQDCCYEVGPEVARRFPGAARSRAGGLFLDLPGALAAQARRLGLSAGRIWAAPPCTRCDRRFFSFRRNKTERRVAALAVLSAAPQK